MRVVVLAAVVLLASSAWALPTTCSFDQITFPMQTAVSVGTPEAAAKSVGVSAASLPLKGGYTAIAVGETVHAVVSNPAGGFWHVSLGHVQSGCSAPEVSVSGRDPVVVRVVTDDGEPDGGECVPESYYWQYSLVSPTSGKILGTYLEFMPRWVGPAGPDVRVDGGDWVARGDQTVRASLVDLEACATPMGKDKRQASMHWVNLGRKATKEKRYDDAIAHFHNAQAIDGSNPKALSGYGYALILRNQSTDASTATRALERALEMGEGDRFKAAVWFNIGLAHRARAERSIPKYAVDYWKDALTAFERSAALRETEAATERAAQAQAAIDRGGRPEICEDIRKFAKPKRYASPELAFGMSGEKACVGGRCSDSVFVFEAEFEGYHAAVRLNSGEVAVFEHFFESWSGAWCPWFPDLEAKAINDTYALISQRGFSMERWEGECHDLGYVYEAALVDRTTGEIVVGVSCSDGSDEKAGLLSFDGDQVRYTDCGGKTRTLTLKQAARCR